MERILITGGAGFIGTHLAERLCSTCEVVLFDNLRRDSLRSVPALKTHPHMKFIEGDILDAARLREALEGCTTVLHLAAIAGVSSYYKEPALTLQVNILGTANLLECCKDKGIQRFIYFSTSEVYGPDAYNVHEGSPHCIGPVQDFRWTYATSKLAGEQLTLRYGEQYGFRAFSVRPFNIYGPRQTGEGAVSNFLKSAAAKQPITIEGDGSAVRAWCYVDDCVDAVMALLEQENLPSGVFNIGNPRETYSTVGLARLVCTVTGHDVPILFKKMEKQEVRVRVPNIGKARELLHFEPKVDLIMGLQRTYAWYQENHA